MGNLLSGKCILVLHCEQYPITCSPAIPTQIPLIRGAREPEASPTARIKGGAPPVGHPLGPRASDACPRADARAKTIGSGVLRALGQFFGSPRNVGFVDEAARSKKQALEGFGIVLAFAAFHYAVAVNIHQLRLGEAFPTSSPKAVAS